MNPISTFIKQTFDQSNKCIAIIGLSGGVDSATSLLLTTQAIGPENVHAFYLPTKKSNTIHLTHIQQFVSDFGFRASNFHILPITSIIQKSWRIIKKIQDTRYKIQTNNDLTNRLRLANLTARTRMMILFDQAKKYDGLVIGTENRSEHMLGYFTRFGDEASDIEPIVHLYKTQVYELAKNLGVPSSILDQPPSADLWPGQTDAAELGFTYAQADPILELLDQNQTVAEIIKSGHDQILTQAVADQVSRMAFKHQVPYTLK